MIILYTSDYTVLYIVVIYHPFCCDVAFTWVTCRYSGVARVAGVEEVALLFSSSQCYALIRNTQIRDKRLKCFNLSWFFVVDSDRRI